MLVFVEEYFVCSVGLSKMFNAVISLNRVIIIGNWSNSFIFWLSNTTIHQILKFRNLFSPFSFWPFSVYDVEWSILPLFWSNLTVDCHGIFRVAATAVVGLRWYRSIINILRLQHFTGANVLTWVLFFK